MIAALATDGMSHMAISALPVAYSRNKIAECEALARRAPLPDFAQRVWPDVPVLAWTGFMSNGGKNEDTATAAGHAAFHEMGYFGTSGGPWNIAAPNTDRSKENDWFDFSANPQVVALLGRNACMTDGCWKDSNGGFPDQCAIGLVSMLAKYNLIRNQLPEGVRPEAPSGIWAIALTFMSWSAGVGGTKGHIRPYIDRLRRVPENERWDRFRFLLADDILKGVVPLGRPRSHGNPAYSALRTQQKIAAATRGYQDNAVDHVLASASFGETPVGGALGSVSDGAGSTLLVPIILAVVAFGAYYLTRDGS